MGKLVECIPNFSEGRDQTVLNAIQQSFIAEGVKLLDFTFDPDHNRSVATVVGEPMAVLEALMRAVGQAVRGIDMRRHEGEHPAIGAADVIPFVPVQGMTVEETVDLSRVFAQMLSARYDLPIYLYGASALRSNCVSLPQIRACGFGALAERMKQIEWLPGFGPNYPHPTAGATIVGVRKPLIAYNVNLESDSLPLAKRIAAAIRERDGGLPCVRALGIALTSQGIVQVSMNLTDYTVTSIVRAFDRVVELAQAEGVTVRESEIIGLVPERAVVGVDTERIRLNCDLSQKILEHHIPPEWLERE